MAAQNLNHKYLSFEIYSDLDDMPAIKSNIKDAKRVARRMMQKYGQAWIYGEPDNGEVFPQLHLVEFWQ